MHGFIQRKVQPIFALKDLIKYFGMFKPIEVYEEFWKINRRFCLLCLLKLYEWESPDTVYCPSKNKMNQITLRRNSKLWKKYKINRKKILLTESQMEAIKKRIGCIDISSRNWKIELRECSMLYLNLKTRSTNPELPY